MRRFIHVIRGLCPHPPKALGLWKTIYLHFRGSKGLSPLAGLGGAQVLLLLLTPVAHGAPAGCVPVSTLCTVGEAEQTVQGFTISRECWEKRIVYSCPDAKPGGACAPLSGDPDCTQTGVECSGTDSDGVCLQETATFRCMAAQSGSGISLEDIADGTPERGDATPLRCGSALYCPDGLCDGLGSSEPNQDFGKAASWIGLLTQMGKEKDPDAVTLFRGEGQTCSRWPLGSKNCCSEDGWLFGCSSSEKILGERRAAKLAHHVGNYCASKVPILGCVTKKQSYCTFRSLFARVLQEQARAQLGMGWGSAEAPDCRPLSIEDIQRVDFSKIDLSEIYGDMLNAAHPPSGASMNEKVKQRIDSYCGGNQ